VGGGTEHSLRPGESNLRYSERGRHGSPTSRSSQLLASQQDIGSCERTHSLRIQKLRRAFGDERSHHHGICAWIIRLVLSQLFRSFPDISWFPLRFALGDNRDWFSANLGEFDIQSSRSPKSKSTHRSAEAGISCVGNSSRKKICQGIVE